MAERVPDVPEHDLALYRAIVGPTPPTPPAAPRLPGLRRRLTALAAPGARLEVLFRLARLRLGEGLRRIGVTNRL